MRKYYSSDVEGKRKERNVRKFVVANQIKLGEKYLKFISYPRVCHGFPDPSLPQSISPQLYQFFISLISLLLMHAGGRTRRIIYWKRRES